jgi:hypothetical protein
MIPQIHNDKIQGEEQLASPVEEKQTGAPLEEQQKQTPPRSQRWRQRILGVALPLVGGFLAYGPLYIPDLINYRLGVYFLGTLVVWLTVLVGALLLRSWWSLLILPGAAYVGTVLADLIVFPLIQGGVPMMQESIGSWIGSFPNLIVAVVMSVFVPLIVAALIGTLLSTRFKRWWEMRKIRQQTKSLYMR